MTYFWSNTLNQVYIGDLQAGDRLATQAEIDAHINPPPTLADYDNAMEDHLKTERDARGYTTREPSPYYDGSSVPRWAQDAADWKAHRDAVMIYGLGVQNSVAAGQPVPTLDDFKAGLPTITWSFVDTDASAE